MNLYEILQNSDRLGEGMTHFERLFAQKVGGGKINEISGVPPLRYIGNGKPLTDYLISGSTIQDGTPTPQAPVDAVGCGIWDETQQSYKLPLTVNGTEYPIYLGEVQTTRRIKKLVLTGEEEYKKNYLHESTSYLYYAPRTIFSGSIGITPVICNELPVRATAPIEVIGINTTNPFPSVYVNFGADIMNAQPSGNTTAGLKEYLAAQYAAGTPVTVWYVLAEPETGIVNEPLMKIGNYADTISFTQAGVTMPTVSGANVLTVPTEVPPSEVWIRGKIKEV